MKIRQRCQIDKALWSMSFCVRRPRWKELSSSQWADHCWLNRQHICLYHSSHPSQMLHHLKMKIKLVNRSICIEPWIKGANCHHPRTCWNSYRTLEPKYWWTTRLFCTELAKPIQLLHLLQQASPATQPPWKAYYLAEPQCTYSSPLPTRVLLLKIPQWTIRTPQVFQIFNLVTNYFGSISLPALDTIIQ